MGIKYLGLVYSIWISCDYKLHGDSKIDLLHVLCGVQYFFPARLKSFCMQNVSDCNFLIPMANRFQALKTYRKIALGIKCV
jgi:hypothetical protein